MVLILLSQLLERGVRMPGGEGAELEQEVVFILATFGS